MQLTKYAPEFKGEAVKQVIDKGHSVVYVAKRLALPIMCFMRGSVSSKRLMNHLPTI